MNKIIKGFIARFKDKRGSKENVAFLLSVFALLIFIAATFFILWKYDWWLLAILILFVWANNMHVKSESLRSESKKELLRSFEGLFKYEMNKRGLTSLEELSDAYKKEQEESESQ